MIVYDEIFKTYKKIKYFSLRWHASEMEFVSLLILNLLQQNFTYGFPFCVPSSPAKRSPHGPSASRSRSRTVFPRGTEPRFRGLWEQSQSRALCRPPQQRAAAPSLPSATSRARAAGRGVCAANRAPEPHRRLTRAQTAERQTHTAPAFLLSQLLEM